MLINEFIVYHAPYWRIAGTGNQSNDFNCVLPVKNIIDAVSAADLHRIDLIWIKVCGSICNMSL